MAARYILGLLLAATLTTAAAAGDQWVCEGAAAGSNGQKVSVTVQIEEGDDEPLSRSVAWDPPRIATEPSGIAGLATPEITLFFDDAERTDFGDVTSILGSVTSTGGAHLLHRLRLSLALDGDGAWTARLPAQGIAPDVDKPSYGKGPRLRFAQRSAWLAGYDSEASNDDLLDAIATARSAKIRLQTAVDRPVAASLYDVSPGHERLQLLAKAWDQAEARRRHLGQCVKAGGEPVDDEGGD